MTLVMRVTMTAMPLRGEVTELIRFLYSLSLGQSRTTDQIHQDAASDTGGILTFAEYQSYGWPSCTRNFPFEASWG